MLMTGHVNTTGLFSTHEKDYPISIRTRDFRCLHVPVGLAGPTARFGEGRIADRRLTFRHKPLCPSCRSTPTLSKNKRRIMNNIL